MVKINNMFEEYGYWVDFPLKFQMNILPSLPIDEDNIHNFEFFYF